MIRADRRAVLKAGAVASVAGLAAPAAAFAIPALTVCDSRIAESRAFASSPALDLAQGWDAVRAHPGAARIEGLTGWSDYVALRGLFGARGLRVVREERVAAPLSGRANLIRWRMVAR